MTRRRRFRLPSTTTGIVPGYGFVVRGQPVDPQPVEYDEPEPDEHEHEDERVERPRLIGDRS